MIEKFGKYVLVKLVATGGMAEVFLAKEFGVSGFQRILAIKRVLPHLVKDREFIEMFTEEARLSAQLTHPNIAQVLDFGLVDGSYYMAMEYIDGPTLAELLDEWMGKGEPMPLDLALHVMCELCQGLDYAHNKRNLQGDPLNLVHRDISPKNVMISKEGAVKLMDFGIAKAADSQRQETVQGTIKGKISYLSPEQVSGEKLDRRSDLFALGIVFYEMMTGRRCFTGDNEFAIIFKIRMGEVEPPSKFNSKIPHELDAIVAKIMHQDRDQRYQSAEQILNDLNQFRYKSGLLASSSKLSVFVRGLQTTEGEDTLSILQKIDWKQVEAQFDAEATASLRSGEETLDAPRRQPAGAGARAAGTNTSKSIRRPAGTGAAPTGTKKTKLAAATPAEDELEPDETLEEPDSSRAVPILVAVSVLLLFVSVATFAFVLWPRIRGPEPSPQPTPTALAESLVPVPVALTTTGEPTPGSGSALPVVAADPSPSADGVARATAAPQPTSAPDVVPDAPPTQVPEPPTATPEPTAVPTPTKRPLAPVTIAGSFPVDVFLEGRSVGRLSSGGLKLQLPPGNHQFVARGYIETPPTFYRADFSVSVSGSAPVTHRVVFPELGTLNVGAAKAATLFIDGVKIDFTPIPKLGITAGPHELRFEFKSGEVSRQRHTVRAGQFSSVFGKP